MNTKLNIKNGATALIVISVLLTMSVIAASAAAPGNDNFTDATVITNLPFSDSSNTSEASIEPSDPWTCAGQYKSIWYTYTPSDNASLTVSASTDYGYYVTLAIYRAEYGGLTQINCLDWEQGSTTLDVTAGATYYFELMARYVGGYYPPPEPPTDPDGGNVTINITQNEPPANDDFANAKTIPGSPYSDSVDTVFATTEPGEPTACGWNFQRTIWYSFTPSDGGSYTAESSGGFYPVLAVYQGNDINNLQALDCRMDWGTARSTLRLEAGTTYYFQTFITYDWWGLNINFSLYSTPPPEANFGYWPGDPSKYEVIQFSNNSYDPVGVGFQSCSWDFGDGSIAADCYPTHQFTADGDYTIQLSVTTYDGRTASTSQTVQIRTHDIGITRFVVPTSARVGQTRQINVYIKNLYYPETVQVDLYKSTPNGYEWVGSLTQSMPIRPANRAQLFTFAYTFTNQDADVGKVTFKAVATIINGRDAYTADNEMISFATRVTR